VDGLAQRPRSHEIDFLELPAERRRNIRRCLDAVYAGSGNLFRQANIHHVARFAAMDQEQRTVPYKPPQRLAHGFLTQTEIPRQPDD